MRSFLLFLGLAVIMGALSSSGRAPQKVLACPIMPSFDMTLTRR